MSSTLFFVISSFLFSSIIGNFVVEYLKISSKIDFITLRGPWNVNVGGYVILGFFIFYITQKIYNGKKDTLLMIIFDILSMALMLFLFSLVVNIPICTNLVLAIYVLYFTYFPLLNIYKRTCDMLFNDVKKKNEQSLFISILFIVLIVLFVDLLLFFIRSYS